MNLFIDANIFLDFYHFSGGDIEELKKLVALVDNSKITLFTCSQLSDEIKRNRDTKINDSMKLFLNANFKISFPAFCKDYEEYQEIRKLLNDANKIHSELHKKAKEHVDAGNLAADILIKNLLSKSKEINQTDELYKKAQTRFSLGNPPGKKKSTIGDELIWETLLEGVPHEHDLVFISGDSDYCSPSNDSTFNSFLNQEWETKKNSMIEFYKSLADFLKEKFSDINIASDVEKTALIERLAKSGSFATTHSVIASLSEHSEFSSKQIEGLIEIAELNNQVNWILGDDDVHNFYFKLLDSCDDAKDTKLKEYIRNILGISATNHHETADPDDEIPF